MKVKIHIYLLLIVLFLAACGASEGNTDAPQGESQAAAETTEVPVTPTLAPAGSPGNPLKMAVMPVDADGAAEQEAALEDAILQAAGIAVDVELVGRSAEALAVLCNSNDEFMGTAWLDGLTYAAAVARNCGLPGLQIQRGEGDAASTGDAGQIIVTRILGVVDISIVRGRTFCRLGYDDLYSWLLPLMIMDANQIDVPDDLNAIVEYNDFETMIQDVAANNCTVAGASERAFAELAATNANIERDARVALTTPAMPYGVLTYPFVLDSGLRLGLNAGLLKMVDDDEQAALLRPFLGQDALVEIAEGEFDALHAFLDDMNVNLTQLGE